MLGERIRGYMREHGISNRSVAKKSGINEKKLSRLLRGQAIHVEDYASICKALGVELNFFLGNKILDSRNKSA